MTRVAAGSARALARGGRTRARGGRRGGSSTVRVAVTLLAGAVAAGVLFLAYLRVSATVAVTSDGAAQALQARDMLAGNWLLHGWALSDVSFYTTELPEYVLVELVRPFGAGVVHVAAAVTYTLLVLCVFTLARGSARGRAGLAGGVLAAAIMLAPQPGYGAFVLLLSPDHTGTQVPLLLGWLLLDRAPRRWWVPAALCPLLALVQFADRIALLTAVLPLVVVCGTTAVRQIATRRRDRRALPRGHRRPLPRPLPRGLRRPLPRGHRQPLPRALPRGHRRPLPRPLPRGLRRPLPRPLPISSGASNYDKTVYKTAVTDGKLPQAVVTDGKTSQAGVGDGEWSVWTGCWYEGALAVAAIASAGVAWAGARLLSAAGGFTGHPLPFTLAPLGLLWTHAWLTGWGILELYGANFLGVTGPAGLTFAVLHLAGLALAVTGTGLALGRFLRRRRPDRAATGPANCELVNSVLALAIGGNLVSYVASIEPGTVLGTGYDAREIAAVLPLGAVLAGRLLGPRLVRLAQPGAGWWQAARWRGERRRPSASLAPAVPPTAVLVSALPLAVLLAVLLAGYPAALGYAAARPAARPAALGANQVLADWLTAHGLRYGLGGAAANAVTADSGARAVLAATTVRGGRVFPLLYQSYAAAYDPRLHDATFLVAGTPPGGPGDPAQPVPAAAVRATFGQPARIFRFSGFTVDVWDVNLLTKLP